MQGTTIQNRHLYFSLYSDSLRVGRSGDRIPVEARFFNVHPDRPWGPKGLFPGGEAAGKSRWTPVPYLTTRLKKQLCYDPVPIWAFIICSTVNFKFIILFYFLIFCWPCISIYLFLNINQLDALNFIISLFQASTCFEHMCSSSGGQKLYYTAFGITTLKQVNGLKFLK